MDQAKELRFAGQFTDIGEQQACGCRREYDSYCKEWARNREATLGRIAVMARETGLVLPSPLEFRGNPAMTLKKFAPRCLRPCPQIEE